MVYRTIIQTAISVTYNGDSQTILIPRKVSTKFMRREVKKHIGTDNFIINCFDYTKIVYGMEDKDFINNARVLETSEYKDVDENAIDNGTDY